MDVYKGHYLRDWRQVRFDGAHPDFPDGQAVVVMTADQYRGFLADLEKLHAEVEGGPEPLPQKRVENYDDTI